MGYEEEEGDGKKEGMVVEKEGEEKEKEREEMEGCLLCSYSSSVSK